MFRRKLKNIQTLLYSAFIARDFCYFGVNASVMYPGYFRGETHIYIGDRVSIGRNAVITTWDTYENENFEPYVEIGWVLLLVIIAIFRLFLRLSSERMF